MDLVVPSFSSTHSEYLCDEWTLKRLQPQTHTQRDSFLSTQILLQDGGRAIRFAVLIPEASLSVRDRNYVVKFSSAAAISR